jgi:DNA recombination-dependent growth factor C
MGLLARSSSVVRFLAAAPPRLDREAMARALARRAFHEPEDGTELRQWYGWVSFHDPLLTELTPADVFFQHYLVVGFRFDHRTVPAKLLFLERRRAERARASERGVERLGRAERQQVKAEVEARLIARALPTPRLIDCVWNLDSGRVFVTGGPRVAREAFVEHFRQTFTVAPVPLIPWLAAEHVGLAGRAVEAVRAVEPATLAPARPSPEADVPRLPLEAVSP